MNKISEQAARVEAEIKKLEAMGGSITGMGKQVRDSVFARFPVVFVLLSTFGLVATLYGFEKVIDEVDFFAEHPFMILLAGLISLALTGTLYKKLN
ncbi:MAG: hypothetical protein H6780_03655 [Candidatus Nomurabacteria bacterium]|nr:MAG: hypothetical protein H6780_03655 [Candidatus Nomurabacteria bacterium]